MAAQLRRSIEGRRAGAVVPSFALLVVYSAIDCSLRQQDGEGLTRLAGNRWQVACHADPDRCRTSSRIRYSVEVSVTGARHGGGAAFGMLQLLVRWQVGPVWAVGPRGSLAEWSMAPGDHRQDKCMVRACGWVDWHGCARDGAGCELACALV